jgi:mevalonate kinase
MNYYASGKLLIFGEYLVLKGAKCLAIPLRYGQKLSVEKSNQDNILWENSDRLMLHMHAHRLLPL